MSGLAGNETRLDPGAINVRLGEGRTAEVLRNLCYQISAEGEGDWSALKARIAADLSDAQRSGPGARKPGHPGQWRRRCG